MQKRFNYKFSSQIWRVIPHINPHRYEWILELRDAERKTVELAAIDPVKGELLWQTSDSQIDWWSTLVLVDGDQIFIHGYRYPEVPEATDLQVFSLLDGRYLYTIPNYFLVGMPITGQPKVAKRVGELLNYFNLDSITGELSPLRDVTDADGWVGANYKLPVMLKKGDLHFNSMQQFIDSLLQTGPLHCIEYLDFKPYMMFSYYIYKQESMDQYILVVNKNREVVVQELLIAHVKATGLGTMILKEDILVYLKNKNTFSSLKFL